MYKRILIPTDGSTLSEVAIEHGVALAKSVGAEIIGLTVLPPFAVFAMEPMVMINTQEQHEKECAATAERMLTVVGNKARAAGVRCEVVHVLCDAPYAGIIETATVRGCDLICMASHGRKGIAGVLLGSETTKVLTHSKIPVLVCR
jgi:nucleotide-binding universal stress UspA family protein